MSGLEPVNTVFGPFHRDPADGPLFRALRAGLVEWLAPRIDVPDGSVERPVTTDDGWGTR